MTRKPRSDAGTPRGRYSTNLDKTGSVGRENTVLKAFWCTYKVKDIMQLSPEELDSTIEEWMLKFQEDKIKRNSSWWYPDVVYKQPGKKKERKINTSFNTSFRRS